MSSQRPAGLNIRSQRQSADQHRTVFSVQVAPGGQSFTVEPGENILAAGRRQGVWLPFECGWGSCSTCKVTLVSGEVKLLLPDAPAVDERDQRRRRIIVCQTTPLSDLVIRPVRVDTEPPPERPVVDRTGRLRKVEDLGPDIRRLGFDLDGPARYRSGQHAVVTLDGGLLRCYSMANAPNGPQVDLVVKRYAGRPGSTAMFALEEGDCLPMTLPFGDMWIRDGAAPIVLIAGGTGISAVHALAAELATRRQDREVTAFYGARSLPELVLASELEAHITRLGRGRYHFVLEHPPLQWTHARGYVTDALARHLSVAPDGHYYLAGPPPMVDASLDFLKGLDVGLDRIHYDRFG